MGKARGCLQLLRAMVGRWRARRAARRRPFTNDSRFFHENRSPTLLIAFIRPSATLLIVRGACPTPFSNGAPFLPHTDSGQIFLLEKKKEETFDFGGDLEITIDAFHSGLGPTTDSAGFKSNKAETPTVLHNATRLAFFPGVSRVDTAGRTNRGYVVALPRAPAFFCLSFFLVLVVSFFFSFFSILLSIRNTIQDTFRPRRLPL